MDIDCGYQEGDEGGGHVRGNVRGGTESEVGGKREGRGKGFEVNLAGAVCTSIQNHAACLVNGIISDTREHGIRCCPDSPPAFLFASSSSRPCRCVTHHSPFLLYGNHPPW